jgi:YVTN family beta-propeller protein
MLRVFLAVCLAAAPAVAFAATAYVTNENGGVSVVDLDTLQITKEIDVGGQQPRGLAITDDGAFLLTANKKTDDVSVIDTKSGTVVRRINVGKGPEFIRIRGNRAYVTYEPDAPGPPPGTPGAAEKKDEKEDAKDKDDDKELAHIAILDLKSWKIVKSIESGLETEGVEFSPDGKNIIATNEGDETISVYNEASGKHVKTINTRSYGQRPRGLKIMPDGKGYVATLEGSSTLLVIDNKFDVIKSISVKTGPNGVAYSPNGKRLIVAASRASTLQIFDAETLAPVAEAAVGMRCWHFAYTPDGSKILVACGRSNDLRVLNAHD